MLFNSGPKTNSRTYWKFVLAVSFGRFSLSLTYFFEPFIKVHIFHSVLFFYLIQKYMHNFDLILCQCLVNSSSSIVIVLIPFWSMIAWGKSTKRKWPFFWLTTDKGRTSHGLKMHLTHNPTDVILKKAKWTKGPWVWVKDRQRGKGNNKNWNLNTMCAIISWGNEQKQILHFCSIQASVKREIGRVYIWQSTLPYRSMKYPPLIAVAQRHKVS